MMSLESVVVPYVGEAVFSFILCFVQFVDWVFLHQYSVLCCGYHHKVHSCRCSGLCIVCCHVNLLGCVVFSLMDIQDSDLCVHVVIVAGLPNPHA